MTDLNVELKKLNTLRIWINLSLVLFIVINALAFATFVVFLVLFIVFTVRGNFNILFLALFVMAIVISLLDNLWYLFKVIGFRRAWRKKFKLLVVPYVFSRVFEEAKYYPEKGIKEQAVRSSGIVSSGNRYKSEDLLVGKHRGVSFTRADVRIQCAPSGGGAATANAFIGSWMIFDFNKPIDAYVRVFERGLISGKSLLGMMLKNSPTFKSQIGASKEKVEGGEKVQVEDIHFNKKFEIVTQNPLTAFYILTPQFIEAVKYLEQQIPGQLILAFLNSRLHVAVNTNENEFEARLSYNSHKNMAIIEAQVLKIAKFIDILRLDNNYFKQ